MAQYVRKRKYTIESVEEGLRDAVLKAMDSTRANKVVFDNIKLKPTSDRYRTFFTKGYKCACCGLEASFFASEKYKKEKVYHLNLYGINKDGEEELFTKDHIVPKSKGGKNHLSNYQTMCLSCNQLKGDMVI